MLILKVKILYTIFLQVKTYLQMMHKVLKENFLLQILSHGILDFVGFHNELIKLIGADNFLFKSSSNDLKIQISISRVLPRS